MNKKKRKTVNLIHTPCESQFKLRSRLVKSKLRAKGCEFKKILFVTTYGWR